VTAKRWIRRICIEPLFLVILLGLLAAQIGPPLFALLR
jgi:hypothetical protein